MEKDSGGYCKVSPISLSTRWCIRNGQDEGGTEDPISAEWTLGQDVMFEDMEQSKNITYEYKIEKITVNINKQNSGTYYLFFIILIFFIAII